MALIDEEILQLDLSVDSSGAIQGIRKMDAAFARSLKDIHGQTAKLDKQSKSYFGDAIKGWRDWRKEAQRVSALPKAIEQQMKANITAIKKARAEMKGKSEEEQKLSRAKIKDMLRENGLLRKTQGRVSDMGQQTINIKFKEAGEELAKSLENVAEPITAAFNKDLPRAVKSGGVMFGRLVEKTFLGLGKKSSKWGKLLHSKGGALGSLGAAKGGAAGTAMGVAGKAMQGLGGITKSLGPLIQSLSTIGPILGLAAGAFAAIVKLLIDAEAQAKDFQKDLLSTASTGEFLAQAGGNADLAFSDLTETVTDLRNAAFDAKNNLEWGITSKEHLAFNNVLTQEGVSILRMRKEFEKARDAGEASGDAAKYYAQQTATAVAFGRLFGVQLNEIGAFQGELMSNLGMSLDSVQKHFATMSAAAGESGMAMNKFFGIIRSVSTDLSLYNMRMDTAVQLLSKLGKAMNPRTAGQFMQTLSKGFKDMGRLDKLRMTLLAGQGKTKELLAKDQEQKRAALTEEMGKRIKGGKDEASRLLSAYLKGGKGAGRELSKALSGVEGGGAMREAATRMKMDQKAQQKGLFGLSQAIGDLGPTAMIAMQKAAVGRFSKNPNGKLEDMIGELGPEMMAENLGISQEQLKQMAMLENVMDETRADLVDEIMKDQGVSEEAAKEQVAKMSDDEILQKSGVKDAKDLLKTEKDYAKDQTDLTTSLLAKVQIIIDYLMNELYNVFTGIWDSISDIVDLLPFGNKAEKLAKKNALIMAKILRPGRSAAMSEAWQKSGGDLEKFKGTVMTGPLMDSLNKAIRATPKTAEQAKSQEKMRRQMLESPVVTDDAIQKAMEAAKVNPAALAAVANRQQTMTTLSETAHDPEVSKAQREAAQAQLDAMSQEKTTLEDLQAILSPEELANVLGQIQWQIPKEAFPSQMANLSDDLKEFDAAANVGATSRTGVTTVNGVPAAPEASAQRPGAEPGQPAPPPTPAGAAPGEAPGVPATGTPPGAPGGQPPPAPAAMEDTAKTTSDQLNVNEGQWTTMQDMEKAMAQKGVRLDKSYYRSQIGPIMEDSTYKAMQKALYEYWLYSATDEMLEKRLGWAAGQDIAPGNAADFAAAVVDEAGKNPTGKGMYAGAAAPTAPHAAGGTVTGITGGMAMVRPPAPGEGWASIGPGERILPAGAGGGAGGGGSRNTLAISVDVSSVQGPDFNRYMETVIRNAIYDYEGRKRLA